MNNFKNVFITGNPGCGKTTLIKEITLPYIEKVGGFYTEEIREGSSRLGFKLHTFIGESGIMALKGMKSQYKLNKYGIDIEIIDKIATIVFPEPTSP